MAPNDECSFDSSEGEPFIGHGVINVFSTNPYLIFPQMKSRITTTDNSQLEQRTIQIRGARVTLDFKDSAVGSLVSAPNKKFSTLFSGPLAPNSGSATDGIFTLIPDEALAEIAAGKTTADDFETEVVGKIVVYGDLAGDEVTSQEFQFPVTICTKCVFGNMTGGGVIPTCPLPAARAGNACNPYQDGVVDCCLDATANNELVCPGYVATPEN
ncbi:MAG: hypothetical protein AB7T06_32915 [Kofleriaceae bacterium]